MFKKTLLVAAVLSTFGATAVNAASTGTLNFNGTIDAATCNVDTGDVTKTVALGSYPADALQTSGQRSPPVSASISVSGCESELTQVALSVTGTADSTNNTLLANTGTASNVGIRLLNADGSDLAINSESNPITLTESAGQFDIQAAMEATGEAGAGSVIGTASFVVISK